MVSMLISLLFALAFALAMAVLVDNWRIYGRDALALRRHVFDAAQPRPVRFQVVTLGTSLSPPDTAVILRPDFSRRMIPAPIAGSGWRDAA